MLSTFTLQTALKGPMHQMKLYPVNHFLYNQKGPLPNKFSVPFAKCLLYDAKHRGSSDTEVIHIQFVWTFKPQWIAHGFKQNWPIQFYRGWQSTFHIL